MTLSKKLFCAVAGVALTLPSLAMARDHDRGDDWRRDYDRHEWRDHERDRDREAQVRFNVNVIRGTAFTGGGAPCRDEDRVQRVWVEPVYRTVCDRVWVPGQIVWTRTRDRAWVVGVQFERLVPEKQALLIRLVAERNRHAAAS